MSTDTFAERTLTVCATCLGTGFTLNNRDHEGCPRVLYPEPVRQAATIVRRAFGQVLQSGIIVESSVLRTAQILALATTESPCPREFLLDFILEFSCGTRETRLRALHETIEILRRVWSLPVGSRKSAPAGYWIITDLGDFKAWVARAKAAPVTQLTTIHKVAKTNFPHFAGQMELEFWKDM